MKDLKNLSKFRHFSYEDILNSKFDYKKEGRFVFKLDESSCLYAFAIDNFGWDHIGAYVVYFDLRKKPYRIPTAEEMEFLKNAFFEQDEVVIEVHPKKEDYVNINEYMLHLWRPNREDLPLPPSVNCFENIEVIDLDWGKSLLVETLRIEGWEIYKVSIMINGKKVNRYPSWNEMCQAKKIICGEDVYALQYHMAQVNNFENSICLYVPSKDMKFPIPEPFMVGKRNIEDVKALEMRKQNPNEYVYL